MNAQLFLVLLSLIDGSYLKSLRLVKKSIFTSIISLGLSCNIIEAHAATPPVDYKFTNALCELKDLDSNWDDIVRGQGDNIRRRLGTVYTPPKCEPSLCCYETFINKFAKTHEDIDLEAFEEPSKNLLTALNQADFLAYSSVFSQYGNGGGGADYIDLSHNQVKKAVVYLEEVIKVLSE